MFFFLYQMNSLIFMNTSMYIVLIPRRVASFFQRFSPFTHTILYQYHLINSYQTVPVRFSGAGASRASPGISIERTAIVVVRAPYIWSYLSVHCFTSETYVSGIEHETCSQYFSHHAKALALSFWTYSFRWVPNHPEPGKHLEKIHRCWPEFDPGLPD